MAVVAGCRPIIGVDLWPQRLCLARALGATHILHAGQTKDLVQAIHKICPKGVHYALDTTGNVGVLQQAFLSLRMLGVCGNLAGSGDEVRVPLGHLLFGRTLRGIVQGDSVPQVFISRLIDLYRQGRFPFDKLLAFYPFAAINQAIADMEAGKVVKPVLHMDGESGTE